MTPPDLLWPGLHRAGDSFGDAEVLRAVVEVEAGWARALEGAALAAPSAGDAIAAYPVTDDLVAAVARESEGGGNPVIPLLVRLRDHLEEASPDSRQALHRGLTSQDVLDTALVLCARRLLEDVTAEIDRQALALARLADEHRGTVMAGRTLGQHALPITFGAKAAGWLRGILAARESVVSCHAALPAQAGGAAGTLAATVEVCRAAGSAAPVASAVELAAAFAAGLGLQSSPPWHTVRHPLTRLGDALVEVSDALGHLANDVALMARPEVAEVSEPAVEGRGVSSAMPQKRNPVLSVLIRRHSQSAPLLGAQLHVSAAGAVDERPDGAWHAEWAPLRDLARRTMAASRQATELVEGLEVHRGAMRANLEMSFPAVLSERLVPRLGPLLQGGTAAAALLVGAAGGVHDLRTTLREQVGPDRLSEDELDTMLDPAGYLGISDRLVDDVLAQAAGSTTQSRTE